jgi:formylglycine-generating enzyme
MRMATSTLTALAVVTGAVSTTARADVFNMPAGYTSLEFVSVGDAGNAADTRFTTPGYGSVAYAYRIGKFEITAAQYCQFLNAVARSSTSPGWNEMMDVTESCGIHLLGTEGNFRYAVDGDCANRPVNWVPWGDAARFCNWLQNGQPNTGLQDLTTTEDGAYYLNGATGDAVLNVARRPGAKYWLPSENEWYKAAYYDPRKPGDPGYWTYPTRSDATPANTLPDGGNSANYEQGDYDLPYYGHTEVGVFANSPSGYGTFDQGGNVREWTDTPLAPGFVVRGGAFLSDPDELTAAARSGFTPQYRRTIGFRVAAAVPEPSVAALLATAVLLAAGTVARLRTGELKGTGTQI